MGGAIRDMAHQMTNIFGDEPVPSHDKTDSRIH
jgi:hypothetical protein